MGKPPPRIDWWRMWAVEIQGVFASVPMHCVDANGLYDVLLGQDWLALINTGAQFHSQIYTLMSSKVQVCQQGQ